MDPLECVLADQGLSHWDPVAAVLLPVDRDGSCTNQPKSCYHGSDVIAFLRHCSVPRKTISGDRRCIMKSVFKPELVLL